MYFFKVNKKIKRALILKYIRSLNKVHNLKRSLEEYFYNIKLGLFKMYLAALTNICEHFFGHRPKFYLILLEKYK